MKEEFHLSGESNQLRQKIIECLKRGTNSSKKYVVVQFYVNRILKVDDVNESVHLDLYLKLNWVSPMWIGKTDDEFQADEEKFNADRWWEPGVEVTNAIELEKMIEKEEAFWLEYPEDGILAYTQRYMGTISAPMNLRQFPFDVQTIPIQFESFHWKFEDCELFRLSEHAIRTFKDGTAAPNLNSAIRLSEWTIESIHTDEDVFHYAFEDRQYSRIDVSINMKRKYGFYVWKLMSVLLLIVVMCWIVFCSLRRVFLIVHPLL